MNTSYQAAHILVAPLLSELNGHISTRRVAEKLSRVQMYLLDQHWKEVKVAPMTQPIYFPDVQIADHFHATVESLLFEEDAWFPGSLRACTVMHAGTWYDVFFGASGKIELVLEAN